MLARLDLRKIARARLKDAQALLSCRRYDGAVYICGYAVEVALKARICKTLRWAGYPSTPNEFRRKETFRTHDLDLLLQLSGVEQKVKAKFLADWSRVAKWEPAVRYMPVGSASKRDAELLIQSAKTLVSGL